MLLANPLFGSAVNPAANEYYKRAEQSFKSRDLVNAEKDLLEALKLEPDNANYRYILAQVQFMQNNFLESKNNMEIVSHSRPTQEKGEDYNNKLKSYKKKIKDLQSKFNAAGNSRFEVYEKNKNSPQKLKLAVTLYQAFRLSPPLRYKGENVKLLEEITKIYEDNLKNSIEGSDWQNEPMLQLAFLYEIANKKDKAAEVYMRALDYIKNPNEEFVITHKFDYLNRSNKEKLLDTIESGEFTSKDIEEFVGDQQLSDEERKKFDEVLADLKERLANAETDAEREQAIEEIKKVYSEKRKSGEFKDYEERLQKEKGKSLDDLLKEGGL